MSTLISLIKEIIKLFRNDQLLDLSIKKAGITAGFTFYHILQTHTVKLKKKKCFRVVLYHNT